MLKLSSKYRYSFFTVWLPQALLTVVLSACGGGGSDGSNQSMPTIKKQTIPDTSSIDTDNDGLVNNIDPDDDNDGINDASDAFPLDESEWIETDNDGLGNNIDPDDDNDGINDASDAFPLDESEWVDTDNDGLGNNIDPDDDNDGINDASDAFPLDESEWIDTDNDGLGNNIDPDDDNDGINDASDAFPLDESEWIDTDNDGLGNNIDPDDDNDGINDASNAFPLDESEWIDTDNDGLGNNIDPDDDNDGINDASDAFPLDESEWIDTDNDGLGNNIDPDDDNDGINDASDAFPLDESEWIDTDNDGLGNHIDPDDDNDGVNDIDELLPIINILSTSWVGAIGQNLEVCYSINAGDISAPVEPDSVKITFDTNVSHTLTAGENCEDFFISRSDNEKTSTQFHIEAANTFEQVTTISQQINWYTVQPVLIIASDHIGLVDNINTAKSNITSINKYAQAWFKAKVGRTYELLPPIEITSTLNEAEWKHLGDISVLTEEEYEEQFNGVGNPRFLLVFAAANVVNPVVQQKTHYIVHIFAGLTPHESKGAAALGSIAVTGTQGATVHCPAYPAIPESNVCKDDIYATSHELGHSFGLGHTCDFLDLLNEGETCWRSFMQNILLPDMDMMTFESDLLFENKFFIVDD